jgi:hypothetical protein
VRIIVMSTVAVAILLAASYWIIASDDRVQASLLVGIGLLLTAAVVWRVRQRRFDIFEPLSVFIIAWTVLFWLRPIAMLLVHYFTLYGYDITAGFDPMLVMALVGGIGFVVGYFLPFVPKVAKRLPAVPELTTGSAFIRYCLALAFLSLVLFGLFLVQSGGLRLLRSLLGGRQSGQLETYAKSTAYFYDGIFLAFPAGLLLIAYGARNKQRGISALGVAALLIPLIAVGPTGVRSWLITLFGAVFILFYLWRLKRPSGWQLAGLCLVGIFSISLIGIIRNASSRQQVGTVGIVGIFVQRPLLAPAALILGPDTEMASLLALEAEVVPSKIPFQYGAATGEVLVHPIPRVLWHGKPYPGDEVLTHKLFTDPSIRSAPRQYSPMADYYLDFSYPGVLAGMLLLGILARVHYEYFCRHLARTSMQVFYAATLPFWLVLLRGSIADTAGRLLFVLPPLLLVLYLAQRKRSTPLPRVSIQPGAA